MPSTSHSTLPAAHSPLPLTAGLFAARPSGRARLEALLDHPDSRVHALSSLALDDPLLDEQPPDLLIVDVADAGVSTRTLEATVRHARRRWPSAGILCLSLSADADAVTLLRAGADDVLARDCAWDVVVAHVAAAVRRVQLANAQLRITFGDLVYDRESRRVWCAGREVRLTPRELQLFDILFLRAGSPVSADTLYDYVWHDDGARASNALAVYVRYLRRKLMGSRDAVLETLRGRGYQLSRRRD